MDARSLLTPWRALAAVLLLGAGCAQSVGDVVQVQPNVLKKSDIIDGVWYFRNTVTYTPFNTLFTFPGQTGSLEKLVWEVQEGHLVGYRSYPLILGGERNVEPSSQVARTTAVYTDKDGKQVGGQRYFGNPIVAYRILSHFDVQRQYSALTGEPTNVIVENTTDRPWNLREFIRVDWSTNQLNRNGGMMWSTVQNPAGRASGATTNWIQPNEPGSKATDWPSYEYDKDTKQLKYMDFTSRVFATPDVFEFPGFGAVPFCYLASGPYVVDCTASEIHMRTSLAKVDVERNQEYEPLVYDDDLMSLFGLFRTERITYDDKFGILYSSQVRLGNRHRVWEQYRTKDSNGIWQPIPMADRRPKPIVYYFTHPDNMGGQERYDELFEPSAQVLQPDFNRAFRRATAAAQKNGSSDLTGVPDMFVLCNNPVKSTDNAACGAPGFSPKFGDLRYSFLNTIAEPVANGLLGYGPSSPDPETGEIISGNANQYTWGLDLQGRAIVDAINLLAGEPAEQLAFITGNRLRDVVLNNGLYPARQVAANKLPLEGAPTRTGLAKGAMTNPTGRMADVLTKIRANGGLKGMEAAGKGHPLQELADIMKQNPDLESLFLDNPELEGVAVDFLPTFAQGRARVDPEYRREALRNVLFNVENYVNYEKFREDALSRNSITFSTYFDRTLWTLAIQELETRENLIAGYQAQGQSLAQAKLKADADLAKKFRQQVWLGTALHEIGHTFNLRHNFQGSWDSVNFFDEYWNIKKDYLTVRDEGPRKGTLPRTPREMQDLSDGPAGADRGELATRGAVHRHAYSSIMDYTGKRHLNWSGIGKYDEAAIIFAYSGGSTPGYVEVFNGSPRRETVEFPGSDGTRVRISGAAVDVPLVNATHRHPNEQNYTERFHFSTVPLHFGNGRTIDAATQDGLAQLKNRRLEPWDRVKRDEEAVRAAIEADPGLVSDPDRAAGVIGNRLLRVPYMYCSDELADGPVQSCYRWDHGADYYEQVRQMLEDYWNNYWFTHFRANRLTFGGGLAFNSAFTNFQRISQSYKHWVLSTYRQSLPSQEQLLFYPLDPLLQDYWTMGVLQAVNQNLNVLAVPQSGLYVPLALSTGTVYWYVSDGETWGFGTESKAGRDRFAQAYGVDPAQVLQVPRGLGRRIFNQYDIKSGYNAQFRILESGHYIDQIGALLAAVLPDLEIAGVDRESDLIRYRIPYQTVFRDEFQTIFGVLWTEDDEPLRPTAYRALDGNGRVTDEVLLSRKRFVKGEDYFPGFTYPLEPLGLCQAGQTPPSCFSAVQNPLPIAVSASRTARFFGLLFGMQYFRFNYDLDYAKDNQVFRLGGSEQFTVAPGCTLVTMPDITTGAVYGATDCGRVTAALKMLSIADDWRLMTEDPTRCPVPDRLRLLGLGCMSSLDAGNPAIVEERRQRWRQQFRYAIRDLDIMRTFYSFFGKAF